VTKNRMTDLRNHLFETLEALKDPEKPMDIARAKAISDVAQTVINSAKVEVDFLKASGADLPGEFFNTPRLGVGEKPAGLALSGPRPIRGAR
jgi:hypothetical protein